MEKKVQFLQLLRVESYFIFEGGLDVLTSLFSQQLC